MIKLAFHQFKTNFFRSLMGLGKGAFFSQIIGFLLIPLLARFYGEEDFAEFALYNQTINLILVFSGVSLLLLMPKEKSDQESAITIQFTFLSSILVLLILGLFKRILGFFDVIDFWLISFGLMATMIYGYAHYYSISESKFNDNSKGKIFEKIGGALISVLLGFNGIKSGMIYGNLIGQFIFIKKNYIFLRLGILKLYKKDVYVDYVRRRFYFFLTHSINQGFEFYCSIAFSLLLIKSSSLGELGYFSMVYRLFHGPGVLVSDYFSQLSLSRVSDFNDKKDRINFVLKASLLVFLLLFPVSIFVSVYGENLFVILLGEKWVRSGEIASYLIWSISATYYIRSLQYILSSVNRQEVYSLFAFIVYGLPVLTIMYYPDLGYSLNEALIFLSIAISVVAVFYFIVLIFVLNRDH